jgi:hypothetical protein
VLTGVEEAGGPNRHVWPKTGGRCGTGGDVWAWWATTNVVGSCGRVWLNLSERVRAGACVHRV